MTPPAPHDRAVKPIGPEPGHDEGRGGAIAFRVACAILLTALALAIVADLCTNWASTPALPALADRLWPALRLLLMPDLWVFALLTGAGLLLSAAFPARLAKGDAVLGAAVATLGLIGNAVFFGATAFWPAYWPDSLTYLLNHPCRSFGYQTLIGPLRDLDPRLTVVLQFNALVLSLSLLAMALARVTGRPLLGCCLLLLGVLATDIWASSFFILTEAPFTALIAAWATFAMLALHHGRVGYTVVASIAAALAITIKPNAVLLLVPTAIAFYGAGSTWRRHLITAVPAITLALGAVSIYTHRIAGVWSPFSVGSFLLAQHMAWAADADAAGASGKAMREVALQLSAEAKSPPPAWHVRSYVGFIFSRLAEYRPVTSAAVARTLATPAQLCTAESAEAFSDLASQFIRARPAGYAAQSLAFYLGSWAALTPGEHALSLSGTVPQGWTAQSRWVRAIASGTELDQIAKTVGEQWNARWVMPDDIRRQARALGDLDKSQINLLIDHLQMVRTICVDCQVALFCLLGVIATLLSLLLLLPRACPRDVRAASMLFAMSCTYLGTSALVNVPLARYSSSVAWLVAAGLLLSISGATTYWRNRPS